MGFLLRNKVAGPLAINDLGITLNLGQDYDLTILNPRDVAISAMVGNDLHAALIAGATVAEILDPLDDSTPLGTAAGIAAAQAANNTHYRIKGGELNQLDDVNAASPNVGDGIFYTGPGWVLQPVAVDVDREQLYFVGKHGNDANTGLTPAKAFLTFGAAITAVTGQTPSATNRFTIKCSDSGIYAESFTIPSFVSVEAIDAKIEGTVQLSDASEITIHEVEAAINNSAVIKVAGTESSRINAEILRSTGTGNTVTTQASETGILLVNARQVYSQNGAAIYDVSTSGNGHIHVGIEDIYITGTGTGLDRGSSTGLILGFVSHILEVDAGVATAVDVASGTVDVHVGFIDTTTAYNVDGPGTLRMFVNQIAAGSARVQTSSAATVDVMEANVLRWTTESGTFTPRRIGFVAIDTSGGPATMNLPTPPSDGDNISFRDAVNTFETNSLTVDAGAGNLIDDGGSGSQTVVLDVSGTSGIFIYSTAIGMWTFTRIQEEVAFSPANLIYVTKNGDDTIGDGSFSNPYLTIKRGLTEALVRVSTSPIPTTVKVLDGVYQEINPLNITGTGSEFVQIQGEHEQAVMIEPTVDTAALFTMTSNAAGVGPALNRLTIDGSTLATFKTNNQAAVVQTGPGRFIVDKVNINACGVGIDSGNGVSGDQESVYDFATISDCNTAVDAKGDGIQACQVAFFRNNTLGLRASENVRCEVGNYSFQGADFGDPIAGQAFEINNGAVVVATSGTVSNHLMGVELNDTAVGNFLTTIFVNNNIEFDQVDGTATLFIQGALSKTKQAIADGTAVSLNYIDTDTGDFIVGNADSTGDPGKEFRVRDFDGRIAVGDNATDDNIASGGVGGSRSFNIIDENGNMRVWRFVDVDGQDPALEFIKGINPANPDGVGDAPINGTVNGTSTITIDVSSADYDLAIPDGGIDRLTLAERAFPVGRVFRVNGTAASDGDYTVVSATYQAGTEEIDVVTTVAPADSGPGGTAVFGGGSGRDDGVSAYAGAGTYATNDPGGAVAAGVGNVWWDWFLQEDDYFVVRHRTGGGGSLPNEKLRVYPDRFEIIGATVYGDADYELIAGFQAVTDAVNYWEYTNAATGANPNLAVIGADIDITMSLTPKGTGTVQVPTGYEANIAADEDLINKAYFDANAGGIFGQEFEFAKDDTLSSTTSTTYVNKLTLTTAVLAGGDYKIEWYAETRPDDGTGGSRADMQVLLDGTTTIAEDENQTDDVVFGTDIGAWKNASGFDIMTLTAASHTIDIEFKVTTPGGANIRRARISITRVS